jgi:deoxyribodipyrimidine photo-lyase
MTAPALVWFRADLRLADNAAFHAAAASGRPLIPVFVLDEDTPGVRSPGGASRWWLHHSLDALARGLAQRHLPLVLRRGAAARVIADLLKETGAEAVYWNRLYDAPSINRDTAVKGALKDAGVTVESFGGSLMAEPWTLRTKQDGFFKVYSPFWRAFCAAGGPDRPVGDAPPVTTPNSVPASDDLDAWGLLPTHPDWADGLRETWTPGEAGADARLDAFMDAVGASYKDRRDFPGVTGTSGLAAHLRFGEIDPRRAWFAVLDRFGDEPGTETFRKELVWREFAYHVLYHVPDLPDVPMDARFQDFPWREDDRLLAAWRRGRTGYPIVDAGMRELWRTGTMHNRVRMVTASFLVKHLLQPWRTGETWFWDTLVDADPASNPFNWQWVSGCGADAAPYFRIFNPQLQGEKFDADGAYVRKWVPEIAALPDKVLHAPWSAPASALREADVVLGETYPHPIVDHAAARKRALAAFQQVKQNEGGSVDAA